LNQFPDKVNSLKLPGNFSASNYKNQTNFFTKTILITAFLPEAVNTIAFIFAAKVQIFSDTTNTMTFSFRLHQKRLWWWWWRWCIWNCFGLFEKLSKF